MDYIPSMVYPFDQTHDPQHLIPFQQNDTGLFLKNPSEKKPNNHRASSTGFAVNGDGGGDDDDNQTNKKRKIMHRDIERQRRQEMSNLYRSLRSSLPLHYIKGKRSISDQMHAAVNYIKDLQNKIQGLSDKRDELITTTESEIQCADSRSDRVIEDSVMVRPCLAGVEVAISTSSRKGLPLSQVLTVLTGQGLTVVNCISTTVNERLLHNIESQVDDGRSIDHLELQQKIMMNLTNPSSN